MVEGKPNKNTTYVVFNQTVSGASKMALWLKGLVANLLI